VAGVFWLTPAGHSLPPCLPLVLIWAGQFAANFRRCRDNMRVHRRREYPIAGSQLAFARVATALAVCGIGALAIGALAVGRLAIKRLVLTHGAIDRLSINELEVKRLLVRELITDHTAT